MRLIEIQDGISIDLDSIEAVVKKDDNTCIIYIADNKYESTTYPYETIVNMIAKEEVISRDISKDEQVAATMKKLDGILNTVGYFAG